MTTLSNGSRRLPRRELGSVSRSSARPVARNFDDGRTHEVTRLSTDGSPNACSALYGVPWRTTRAQGATAG
jgi:hypothetical protein